ncbi:MAG: radical SAM family heme chaperone HemW [Coriobacteriales bacterium]|jgi:oxygen-independent coproporphyrinogen-3 oxidase|nr:radical SAM family heme chaperone HemW [Coriobacteriales bacterium]
MSQNLQALETESKKLHEIPTSNPPYQALYLHIPFCAARCSYCDFVTEAITTDSAAIDRYLDDLLADVREAFDQGLLNDLKTVYVGGGTPSHLGQDRILFLLQELRGYLKDAKIKEFTLEANPDSLVKLDLPALKKLGLTRISLGVQSFDDLELEILGRIHDAREALEAIYQIQASGLDLSIDLICGIPGQSLDSWLNSLQQVEELMLDHISIYPLSLEELTPLAVQLEEGADEFLELPDDDEQAADMLLSESFLGRIGLKRYEISSYSRPGHESKHNMIYWTGQPYLGLGKGAVSMAMLDACNLTGEVKNGLSSLSQPVRIRFQEREIVDELDSEEAAAEDLMMRMRLADGISEEELRHLSSKLPKARQSLDKLVKEGLLEYQHKRYRPTQRGWLMGNCIFETIWDLVS